MIHAQRQAPTGIGAGGAQFGQRALGNRLQGGEAITGLEYGRRGCHAGSEAAPRPCGDLRQ